MLKVLWIKCEWNSRRKIPIHIIFLLRLLTRHKLISLFILMDNNPTEEAPAVLQKKLTNVRWQFEDDVMDLIAKHQDILKISWRRKVVTQEEAVQDLIRSRKLPKIIISHE